MFNHQHDSAAVKNAAYASYGIEALFRRFPLGALNRADIKQQLIDQKKALLYASQIKLLQALRDIIDEPTIKDPSPSVVMKIFDQLQGGFCHELTTLAKFLIETKYAEAKVEIVTLDNHVMLVIGREQDSISDDIETWGKSAVICDPWAQKMYLASQFEDVRASHDIKYFVMDPDELKFYSENEHYLQGKPIVDPDHQEGMLSNSIKSVKKGV